MLKPLAALERIRDSPTLNTWLSYSTRAISLFVVLPLILRQFSEGEVALWYLFATVISLQSLVDMGFKMTFVRFMSYAAAGSTEENALYPTKSSFSSNASALPVNLSLLAKVYSTMKRVYVWLLLLFIPLMCLAGTWSMYKPIQAISNQKDAWISWAIIVAVSSFKFYGSIYANCLEGMNKIALVRRWEALTSIAAIINSIVFLLIFKSLLSLVIANQIWVAIGVVRNYFLCRQVEDLSSIIGTTVPFDPAFFRAIWQPTWRSGVSGLMSNGLTNITSILYAQIGDTSDVAAYLLALRLMAQIREVSMAPFYSKIPTFARYQSLGEKSKLVASAQKGMFLSNMVFAIGAILTGIFINELLKVVGSKVVFIDQTLWLILTLAYFIHRYGAMHIQLYSTTNHIISHIADGVSGIIYVVASYVLIQYLGIYAIPVGMILGYLGFYAWYAARYSYRSLNVNFLQFEKKASLVPAILITIYTIQNFI